MDKEKIIYALLKKHPDASPTGNSGESWEFGRFPTKDGFAKGVWFNYVVRDRCGNAVLTTGYFTEDDIKEDGNEIYDADA